jgi:hypothetical protein
LRNIHETLADIGKVFVTLMNTTNPQKYRNPMERLGILIRNLQEGLQNGSSTSDMLMWTGELNFLLLQQLADEKKTSSSAPAAPVSRVAVVMPWNHPAHVQSGTDAQQPAFSSNQSGQQLPQQEEKLVLTLQLEEEHIDEFEEEKVVIQDNLKEDVQKKTVPVTSSATTFGSPIFPDTEEQIKPIRESQFDLPLEEIPTLTHQKVPSELNDVIAARVESLNEKFQSAAPSELGFTFSGTPVKDLKKAIGINDRFVFINELFRGDEIMFERSIKTINNFHIYPEAVYWMERELKIKLGWDERHPAAQHFYELVKRRFAGR